MFCSRIGFRNSALTNDRYYHTNHSPSTESFHTDERSCFPMTITQCSIKKQIANEGGEE